MNPSEEKPASELITANDAQMLGLPSYGGMVLLKKFCQELVGSPFLPKTLTASGNPAGTLLAVVLKGREMGLQPMQSVQAFWMSPDGRLGMYADSMMAVMLKAGLKFNTYQREDKIRVCRVCGKPVIYPEGMGLDAECHWEVERPDGQLFHSTFSVSAAKLAQIFQRDRSLWPRYPERMTKWRVISDLFHTAAGDLGGAQVYTPEEIQEFEPEEKPTTPTVNPFVSAARASAGAGATQPAVAQQTVDTTASEPSASVAPAAEDAPAAPAPPTPTPERRQRKKVDPPALPAPPQPAADVPAPSASAPQDAPAPSSPEPATEGNEPYDQLKTKLREMTDLIKTMNPTVLEGNYARFITAYLGVEKFKRPKQGMPDQEYAQASAVVSAALMLLPVMEAAIGYRPDDFKNPDSAASLGKKARKSDDAIRKMAADKQWSKEAAYLAMVAMNRMQGPGGSEDFLSYLTIASLDGLPEDEVRSFLRVAALSRKGIAMKKACATHGTSMQAFLSDCERSLGFSISIDLELEQIKKLEALIESLPVKSAPKAEDSDGTRNLWD